MKGTSGYTFSSLFSFNDANGAIPLDGLAMDSQGDLFGTTVIGGASSDGTIFELKATGVNTSGVTTYATAPAVLASFNGTDGNEPYASLTLDNKGDLFGTTYEGGSSNLGVVFELGNSGTVQRPSIR